jgi:hypothetical protein
MKMAMSIGKEPDSLIRTWVLVQRKKSTLIEDPGGETQFAEMPKKSRKRIEKLDYVLPEEPITKKG